MAAARRPEERGPAAGAPEDAETRRRRLRHRNWAVLAALVAFAALIYVVAIVRMGGG